VPHTSVADEPFAIAVRSQTRLARALKLIGIVAGSGGLRLYADLDPLGAPIVVIGPLGAELADRVSSCVERGPLLMPGSDLCP
jgi:hypothetical protein